MPLADGTVVNLMTGEVMTISVALERGFIVDKCANEKDPDMTSEVSSVGVSSTVSSIYDRVSSDPALPLHQPCSMCA